MAVLKSTVAQSARDRLKILILNDYGVESGGAERISIMLRDGLRARGHDARLYASTAQPITAHSEADYSCFGTETHLRRILQASNPMAVWGLRRVLHSFRPDLVHVRMFMTQLSPFILPLLKDVPSLHHIGSYQPLCPLNTLILPDGSSCRRVAGIECHRAGCVSALGLVRVALQHGAWNRWRHAFNFTVANSEYVSRRLRDAGFEVDQVIHNGASLRPGRRPLTDLPVVAYAGRLVPKKGLDVLLRAMVRVVAQVPNVRFLIAGTGPDRRKVQKNIASLGLRGQVVMLGHKDRASLERCLAPAWVQIVPSVYEEPFPNVAIEAMMRGTAVIASATGGICEIVRDGRTGFLVPPGNEGVLAERIVHLLRNRNLADEFGAAGRKVALSEFTEDQMVNSFVDVYSRLAARPDLRRL